MLERQIEEMCARDEFEKAELLDVEVKRLQERLRLVAAVVNDAGALEGTVDLMLDDDDQEEEEEEEEPGDEPLPGDEDGLLAESTTTDDDLVSPRTLPDAAVVVPRARVSRRLARVSGVRSHRGSGAWQDIPLTPTPQPHNKSRPPAPGSSAASAVPSAAALALSTTRVLDVIFSFLRPEELGRLCGVNRQWRDRIDQDEIWHPLFRPEWQHEIAPSPGTYKRWYGAMRSAPISWLAPILQQETVRHDSLAGRVELRTYGQAAYLVAMTATNATVWDYSSLQMLHEVTYTCAYALGSGQGSGDGTSSDSGVARLIGGDKKTSRWLVWDIFGGQQVFSCAADDGAFSGGWYIVHRNCVVVFRRLQQSLRGYVWNYETPNPADIVPPMLAWEMSGNYAMPKATRHGLLCTDFLHGLVRIAYDDGAVTVLLKEKSDDLDPRNPRVRFHVDRAGTTVTRKSSARNAPVLVYAHSLAGLRLLRSIRVPVVVGASDITVRMCTHSEDYAICFGVVEQQGKPLHGVLWRSDQSAKVGWGERESTFFFAKAASRSHGSVQETMESTRLQLDLRLPGVRFLDAAIANNVVAGLFGDLVAPSELYLWDARTGKELTRMVAELGQRPYNILRFTGLTACLLHKDGALTKLRVVGRRASEKQGEGQGSCELM